MDNRTYVVAEVGYEALFEAMVAQAEADIAKAEADAVVALEMMRHGDAKAYAKGKTKMDNARKLRNDAKDGLTEWLKVLRVLDIADAVIG